MALSFRAQSRPGQPNRSDPKGEFSTAGRMSRRTATGGSRSKKRPPITPVSKFIEHTRRGRKATEAIPITKSVRHLGSMIGVRVVRVIQPGIRKSTSGERSAGIGMWIWT